MSFRRHRNMRFIVLLNRERARIGLAAAKGAIMKMRRQLGTTNTRSRSQVPRSTDTRQGCTHNTGHPKYVHYTCFSGRRSQQAILPAFAQPVSHPCFPP